MDRDEEVVVREGSSKEQKTSRLKAGMSKVWTVLGKELPRSEVIFFSQMFIVCIVVIASIYNLSIGNDKSSLWIALLTSSCSYLMPPPQLRKN